MAVIPAQLGQDAAIVSQLALLRSALRRLRPWSGLMLLSAALVGCVPAHRSASWTLYPLQRNQPHDGLAVVSQPDGYGLHIWLETDTSKQGVCKPRWLVDPARLFNGNGTAPFSSGLATRAEFFEAVARKDVQRALKQQLEALCKARAPKAQWQWSEPPLTPEQVTVQTFPLVEEQDLLPSPYEVRQQEEELMNGAPPAS
jgi:hypothetical protein